MKAILHNNELILQSENIEERMFIQDFKGDLLDMNNWMRCEISFEYNKTTETLKIIKEKIET